MEMLKPDNYIISGGTHFLKSDVIDGRNHTFIMDKNGAHDCPKSITRVINNSCRKNGISLQRMRAQSKLFFTERCNKRPVVLAYEHNTPVVFFPLYSPRNTDNIWINCNNIIAIEPYSAKEVAVTFSNQYQLILPATYSSFSALYVRAVFYQRYLRDELPKAYSANT